MGFPLPLQVFILLAVIVKELQQGMHAGCSLLVILRAQFHPHNCTGMLHNEFNLPVCCQIPVLQIQFPHKYSGYTVLL